MNSLTLILPIHIESEADEAAASRMLDSLEGDSIGLCQFTERLVLLSGTYSRPFRGRCHKMASRLLEALPQTTPNPLDRLSMIIENERTEAAVVVLNVPCEVEKGWLDRLVIEADRQGTVVSQGAATYYPRVKT